VHQKAISLTKYLKSYHAVNVRLLRVCMV
jgi:hypothetical protein